MSATRSLISSSRKKKSPQPFYNTSGITTSAKIIEEARRSVRGALPTNRPFTPAEPGRILFGQTSLSRPPSVYSIGARHFSDERRPSTSQKLAPIEQTALEDGSFKVTLYARQSTNLSLFLPVSVLVFILYFCLYRFQEAKSIQLPPLRFSPYMISRPLPPTLSRVQLVTGPPTLSTHSTVYLKPA